MTVPSNDVDGSSSTGAPSMPSSPSRTGIPRRKAPENSKDSLRQTAVSALMQLSVDDENKNAVREAGGLKHLIDLLGSLESDVNSKVLGALTNLALNDENKTQIRELQAIPKIVSILEFNDQTLSERAADVLWNLAGSDENRVEILQSGGVAKLLGLLPSGQGCEGNETIARALGALANLAVHPDVREAMLESDGIELIVNLLKRADHVYTKERAAGCIEHLALDRPCRIRIHDLGGSPGLMRLLISDNEGWVRAAVGALKNLTVDEEFKVEIAQQDGLEVLVQLLRHTDIVIAGKSAECISHFALEADERASIRKLGALPSLLMLLEPASMPDARLAAAGAILNLLVDDECKVFMRNGDGLQKLVPLLDPSMPLTLRAVTVMALTNLAVQEEGVNAIGDAGGIELLVQNLSSPTDDTLQEKSCSALCNISVVTGMKTVIRKVGGIPPLLNICEFSTFGPTIENCLLALISLAETPENRVTIAQAGGVGYLVRLMASDEHPMNIAEKAAGVIWNLAHEESVQHTMRQLGGLKTIIQLLDRDNPDTTFNVIGALVLLMEQEENVQTAFDLGVVPRLTNTLHTCSNVTTLQHAVHVLGQIAECCSGYQTAIREARGLARIVDVMARWAPSESDDDSSLGARAFLRCDWRNGQDLLAKCCYAVWMICQANEVNKVAFRAAGGIGMIVRLVAPLSEDTLLEMAAGAVCALCEGSTENKDAFRENGGLEPFVELLEHPCDTVKLNAAKALCHLAESTDNRTVIRELGGLDKLVKLLSL